MINVAVLTFQNGFKRGATDFYPLIKWDKLLRKEGIKVQFFSSHDNKKIIFQDVVLMDYRYYRTLTIHEDTYPNKKFIIEFIHLLKKKNTKVILFDSGDGAGGRQWDLIEHVDILLKKQLLKDRQEYTLNKGAYSYMVFLSEYNLSKKAESDYKKYKEKYTPCPEDQLHKIKLGWNIGMIDYRTFPLSRYYPMGTSRLLNSIYQIPKFDKNLEDRAIDSTFRGELRTDKESYNYQRNKVIQLFRKEKYPNYVTGDIISKKAYLKELKNSKTCVSPFGWGEVCFRDFEAIINGCLLIKPDMDHLETWPDLYRKNETYVSLKWDMSDLEQTLNEVVTHFDDYKPLIKNAQYLYKETISDGEGFVKRFKRIL